MDEGKDVDDFPVGSRVQTPSGRFGIVIKHRGYESKFDDHVRVIVQFEGSDPRDLVALQPGLLKRAPTKTPSAPAATTRLQDSFSF